MFTNYKIEEHIHRFGVWTAARAASKSRLKNKDVELIFKNIRLLQQVENLRTQEISDLQYCEWIKKTGDTIIEQVKTIDCGKYQKDNFCFGLAAKLISIYIKTVEVLPTGGSSHLSAVAYPPLDAILLKNVSKVHGIKEETNWSTFNWHKYIKWINFLRAIKKDEPWWKLEVYWSVEQSDETNDIFDKGDLDFKYAGCKYHGNRLDPTCPECNDIGGMNEFDKYSSMAFGKNQKPTFERNANDSANRVKLNQGDPEDIYVNANLRKDEKIAKLQNKYLTSNASYTKYINTIQGRIKFWDKYLKSKRNSLQDELKHQGHLSISKLNALLKDTENKWESRNK